MLLGEAEKKGEQLAPFALVEGGEELVFEALREAAEPTERLSSGRRDLDDLPAAIGGVAAPFDQTGLLELVEQADQLALVVAESVGDRALRLTRPLVVNVALPSIKHDLGFSQANLQWVVSAYAIFFGGALLLGGRLADLLGRRRLFVTGLLLFAASSLLCGIAWSEGSLILFRAVQGLGGALLAPAALSLLVTTFVEGL